MADKLHVYGYCTRLDGTRIPVYYFYEIEEGRVQVHHKATDTFVDIEQRWGSLAGGRPNRPHRVPLEVTEMPRKASMLTPQESPVD